MFGSAILDVAVGLIFIYFLLSVVASHIDEFIAERMQWRARELEAAIRGMLKHGTDPAVEAAFAGGLATKVLSHSLITALRTGAVPFRDRAAEPTRTDETPGRRPAYIPPRTFALALLDTVAPSDPDGPRSFKDVRDQIARLPAALPQRATLLALFDGADGKLEETRAGIEKWFNGAMDRVSGAYRRRVMYVNLVVALALSALIGVDTIAIATTIWHDQGVRAAVAGAAGAQQQGSVALDGALTSLGRFGLPLGWSGELPSTALGWYLKAIGILLTAGAVSLGGPFWFDVLKNISNLRSSGPPPAPSAPAPQASPPAIAPFVIGVPAASIGSNAGPVAHAPATDAIALKDPNT